MKKQRRPLQAVHTLVIDGGVDVVIFQRGGAPGMEVLASSDEAIASVTTTQEGGTLRVARTAESGGVLTVRSGHAMQHFYGPVGQVVGGDLYVDGKRVRAQPAIPGHGPVHVLLEAPVAPTIRIRGGGQVSLLDLVQDRLIVVIEGGAAVKALGSVGHLKVRVTGAAHVDAKDLDCRCADLEIVGAGTIDANAATQVRARVTGAGDIVVRGQPAQRDTRVTGVGSIRFR